MFFLRHLIFISILLLEFHLSFNLIICYNTEYYVKL